MLQRNIERVTNLFLIKETLKIFLKYNNEASKQEQDISLNPKKNLLDTLHGKAFKGKRRLKI